MDLSEEGVEADADADGGSVGAEVREDLLEDCFDFFECGEEGEDGGDDALVGVLEDGLVVADVASFDGCCCALASCFDLLYFLFLFDFVEELSGACAAVDDGGDFASVCVD